MENNKQIIDLLSGLELSGKELILEAIDQSNYIVSRIMANRAYDIYSTIEYADKLSGKDSVNGLSDLVEKIKMLKEGAEVLIISINTSKITLSIFTSNNYQEYFGIIESKKK